MEQKQELKYFVRIGNSDLDGKKSISQSLTTIKGIGFSFANAVCSVAGIDKLKKTGYLGDDEAKQIEDIINNPSKYGIPCWLYNRRKDPDTNEDRHLITSTLTLIKDNDIKLLKKIKSYKGIRHALGLPVRGQKTRSNFRKNKGKVMGVKTGGVKKGGKT